MAFSYSVRINVDKELPPVSSGDYDLDFCSSGAANQTPPKLQISLAAFGTAAIDAVIAECYTVGTSDVTLLTGSPFSTATATWVYLRESSGNAAADLELVKDVSATNVPFSALKAGDVAFFRHDASHPMQAVAASTNATGTIQVVCIGE
jgi:hypothetical protein